MKEQSHKEEMSAALRGDFQRLRERGVLPALVPPHVPEPEADASAPPAEWPADEKPQGVPVEAGPARRGWLSRLAGR